LRCPPEARRHHPDQRAKADFGYNLSPEIVDPEDIETLTDILIAGINEAIRVVDDIFRNQMKRFTGGMGMPGCFKYGCLHSSRSPFDRTI
jgi:hypothetical protein